MSIRHTGSEEAVVPGKMVATRRGARARSPSETSTEERLDVQATPSTVRRTRSSAKLQATPVQLEESGEGPAPSAAPSTKNRYSRVLEPHSPQQGSIHDADTSDLDSCYSVEFAAATQTRATRRKTQRRDHESDISDVESCSSAASKPGYGTPRRTRRTTGSESSGAHPPEVGGATVDPPVEVRSGGPVRLESQRVTRRSTRSKTPAKRQPADSELSEPDSCTSSVSERTSRRQKRSIPVHTDQLAESSPVRTLRQTRATRSRVVSTVSEPPSCDSEGFESGPSSSLSTRKKGKVQSAKVLDSESEEVDLHSPVSPCSTGSRTTPCSSRASSGTASRRRPLSRISAESQAVVVESDESLNDSKLETTVIAAEDTLLEEETVKLTEEQKDVNDDNLISKEARREKTDVPECDENDDSGPAVMAKGQQREPSAEGNAGDSSEMETMQENISSSEASRSVTVSFCEKVPEMMEVEEKQGLTVDTSLPDTEKETPPCEEEEEDKDADILWSSRNSHLKDLSSRIDPGINVKQLGGLYISFDGSKSNGVSASGQKQKGKKILDEVMKKSIVGPDFEKKDAVPPYKESKEALKLKRRAERQKSTGDGWFNMKAPEISQELKGDLQVLKMRGSLDPKRFYKKNDRDGFPKYFQVGTVVDSPLDFYHSRVPKKQRKRTMVEELLTDAEFRQKNKKRFQQIMAEKAAQAAGKKKKKSKFHKKST
uniref:Deoxynucleotidyltransferase, terminal, interacting protein 2 n=1 Tax=Oryzias latipes TaxID=8090 RepID=A0A3P9KYH8_ORYLA